MFEDEFFQLSHLVSPFNDFYVFEGYETFSEVESHLNSSFASSNTQDDQNHFKIINLCSSFDCSSKHQGSEDQDQSSSRSWEELMGNENRKTRIKWTKELHQKFIDAVDQLGGAQKATPKQLLHLMNIKGLTLIHIKSHLQKYRISRHIQDFSKGKCERKTNKNELLQSNQNIGKQLMEVVRQQIDTQTSLNEQLEVQKNLITAIEEQMKQLREVLELRNDLENK